MSAEKKKRYLITNVVYGDLYLKIFLDHHLKSVLDPTNLPAMVKDLDIIYRIYTDADTQGKIVKSQVFKELNKTVTTEIEVFNWNRSDQGRFSMRYSVLLEVFHDSVRNALERKFDYATAWVADLIVAKEFFSKVFEKMREGHGAVMVLPMRAMFETMAAELSQINGAWNAMDLFKLGYRHLHTLFRNNEWTSPRFTQLPFYLLWSTRTGMMARTFSWTPIVFEPKPEMLEGRGMIDGDVPEKCRNPFWCENWTDAPVMGIEPVICYAQHFHNFEAQPKAIREWAHRVLHPSQIDFLSKALYYPDKATAALPLTQKIRSDFVVKSIQKEP